MTYIELFEAGSGVECIYGRDNTVYEWGAGTTAANRERVQFDRPQGDYEGYDAYKQRNNQH